MATSKKLIELKASMARLIAATSPVTPRRPKDVRSEVLKLAAIFTSLDAFSRAQLPSQRFGRAALDRIREYMKLYVGQVIDGDELRVVSGIQEYARRVRQLKVEFGYDIVSGMEMEGMRPEQYKLLSASPDKAKAENWRIKNQIRRQKGSSESRVLAYLKANLGKIVESDDLHYVAKKKDYDRRVRALRSEKGWRIRTRLTGDLNLTPKQYVLESLEQLPEHDRKISSGVFDKVLIRDGYKCVKCGWGAENRRPDSKAQNLQVHHKLMHRQGGSNEVENLVTLCNVHHVEIHKRRIDRDGFDAWKREA